jgi:hypothetical protein
MNLTANSGTHVNQDFVAAMMLLTNQDNLLRICVSRVAFSPTQRLTLGLDTGKREGQRLVAARQLTMAKLFEP